MREQRPALSIVPTPGRWQACLDLAQEAERRGFDGLYVPSLGEAMAMCQALAHTTTSLTFGTSIVNIYARHPADYARTAATIHELSGGRFRFGIGVSHGHFNKALGLATGKPLADVRAFVETLRGARGVGELPPLVLATLRDPMIRLAGDLAEGIVFANASRSRTPASLDALPVARREDPSFFIGNMIPVCIDEDEGAGAARNRATLAFYLGLPNYRAYWKAAGYVEEMQAVETAIEAGRRDGLAELAGDVWLADCTLFGSAAKVREGVEAWREAGVRTPILVPSSTSGGQAKAVTEVFAAYA
jgi:alkanesulfonate monooxygenase SsuD/methylene tetrahydromethanopterin reductase-like flavin-dependent oxidoreductase (luciferase family)